MTDRVTLSLTREQALHAIEALDQARAALKKNGFTGRAYQHVETASLTIARAVNGIKDHTAPVAEPTSFIPVHGMEFEVYQRNNDFCMAMTRHGEDAAALVAVFGDGATVKDRAGRTVWTEGKEDHPAGESYDGAAATMIARSNTR